MWLSGQADPFYTLNTSASMYTFQRKKYDPMGTQKGSFSFMKIVFGYKLDCGGPACH